MYDIQKLPHGKKWRELWLPEHICGSVMPSSVANGLPMTLTGASKQTTYEGIHFVTGVATSNVKFSDPYDAVNDWWASFDFILDADFDSGSANDMHLLGKYDDGTNYLTVRLNSGSGKLTLAHVEGGVSETLDSSETSWTAGVRYHVLVSCSTTGGQRVRIDGGTAQTAPANTTAVSLTYDMCIGARDDGVDTNGCEGVIKNITMGNDILTTDEEYDLYLGFPPTDAVTRFLFDEGRGTTTTDRGSGADDGTMDTSCSWVYSSVKAPGLSFDGLNDQAITAATGSISWPLTLVWAGKLKGDYTPASGAGRTATLMLGRVDGQNIVFFQNSAGTCLRFGGLASGVAKAVDEADSNIVDSYHILLGVVTSSGLLEFWVDGVLQGTSTALGALPLGGATWGLGFYTGVGEYDPSMPIFAGVINDGLTHAEARLYSNNLNVGLGLGL